MKIEVKIVCENPDGSADAEVEFDDEGQCVLIQYGIVAMLIEALEKQKNSVTIKQTKRKSK